MAGRESAVLVGKCSSSLRRVDCHLVGEESGDRRSYAHLRGNLDPAESRRVWLRRAVSSSSANTKAIALWSAATCRLLVSNDILLPNRWRATALQSLIE